jgi:hypothetical protein
VQDERVGQEVRSPWFKETYLVRPELEDTFLMSDFRANYSSDK